MSCTTRRPLGPPLLNQRISRFHVPYRHYNMSTSLRKLPANSYNNKYKLKRFTLLFPLTPTKRSNTTSKAKGNLCFLFRDLAVSEPMPLVEPMTMHLFFYQWQCILSGLTEEEELDCVSGRSHDSLQNITQPLNHTIQTKRYPSS